MVCDITYDRNGRHDLQQIRSQTLEQAFDTFVLDSLPSHVHDARVRSWMASGALTLQACSEEIQWVDDASAKRTAEPSHQRQREVPRQRILFMLDALGFHVARHNGLLQCLEHKEVDGRVGEHPNKTHRKTAVEGDDTIALPHLLRSMPNELVAVFAACDGFALHSKLQSVQWVNDSLRHHTCQATGNEL